MEKPDLNSLRVNTQLTTGEALYIIQGSPQKLTKSIGSMRSETEVNGLLQFDLKFDALKTYLEGFSTVVNQHASIINGLQADLQTRLIENNLYGVIDKLGASSIIQDKTISGILNPMLKVPRAENTGRRHEDTVNVFCNKLEVFTHGFAHLHKADLSLNDKLIKIDSQIAQKVNTEDFRAKVKKTKTKLRTKMDENHKVLEDKIKALEAKLAGRMDGLDRKIDEVEKHTTWRIKDCEDLLRSRINDTYVDDAIRLLEERLSKEIEKITLGNADNLNKSLKELTQRLKNCEDHVEDKVNGLKKNIKEVELNLTKRVEVPKFDEFKKEILAKIEAQSDRIQNLSKKVEPPIERLGGDMQKANQDIIELRAQIKNLTVEIENLTLEITSLNNRPVTTIQQVTENRVTSDVDGEALRAEMESYFSRSKNEINKLRDKINMLEESMHTKVDTSYFSIQLAKKLDISEFERMIASIQSDQEKIKRFILNNEDLQNKINQIEELIDKKIAKLRKDLDINNLMKLMKTKAEEDNVIKGFDNTDKKINALSENLIALKKELDQAFATLEKLAVNVFSYSDAASLSTKKMNPLNCLSCGNLSRNFVSNQQATGIDGKFYRIDRDYAQLEVNDAASASDLRGVLGKTLNSVGSGDKMVNVAYFSQQQTITPIKERSRPQTANTKGKFFKNSILTSSPTSVTAIYSQRPGSAKK